MKNKILSVISALFLALGATGAQAEMITDAHGNVGYDTAAECDAAVSNGTARFYTPFTHKPPLLRRGEKGVQQAKLSDLGEDYKMGACDLGVGHKDGRDGVSVALQGKYVPYSPDMPINAYTDKEGTVVRVSMGQCDNWFSDNAPRPVRFVKEPEPVAVEEPAPAPVEEPAPVAEPAPKMSAARVAPYVFATMGALHNGVTISDNVTIKNPYGSGDIFVGQNSDDTRFGGQVGAGILFNDLLGTEVFYQGARRHHYKQFVCALQRAFGARATVGTNVGENTRVFGKVGAAGVQYDSKELGKGKFVARPTAGVGITHNVNENWAVRADYDHIFRLNDAKRTNTQGAQWKGSNYLGAGVQYKF
ncbi:outer membrane beta-barrel protein [Conchiformibius kuhniae]|uniref:Outer membrane beta-barrel protein n=1 Tax=Conchiformibius kuhniae TaxID=211502 RepID=A0A8T9MW85_9NEIS|nr:outer membrane beta-barrel protein [Conchiformibius kuhniae]UOP05404.1 outer membrane beta-barrel protein [Conchiformibius kuhniae]